MLSHKSASVWEGCGKAYIAAIRLYARASALHDELKSERNAMQAEDRAQFRMALSVFIPMWITTVRITTWIALTEWAWWATHNVGWAAISGSRSFREGYP